MKTKIYTISIFLFILAVSSYAQLQLDIESGMVFSGYNDVRIPNDTGTKISLTDELKSNSKVFFRVKGIYAISEKHVLSLLVAPLRLKAEGSVNRLVRFEGAEFPANTPLASTYRFDSYRLTYRYNFYRSKNLHTDIGFTAKIRDASVRLEGNNKRQEKKNTGFVPLINFQIHWLMSNKLSLILEGDALASPQGQGRAEDVLLALQYNVNKNIDLKLGYRILEGGADVDEVYNFALLHYSVFGAIVSL